jgi:hypothetical protein
MKFRNYLLLIFYDNPGAPISFELRQCSTAYTGLLSMTEGAIRPVRGGRAEAATPGNQERIP